MVITGSFVENKDAGLSGTFITAKAKYGHAKDSNGNRFGCIHHLKGNVIAKDNVL
jgi:hypothetical protein